MKEPNRYQNAKRLGNLTLANKINKDALGTVGEAFPILWKVQTKPENQHLCDSRTNGMPMGDFLVKIADGIMQEFYGVENYNILEKLEDVPEKVKTFVEKINGRFRSYQE